MASSFPPRCKCVPQQTQAYQALICNQAHEDQTQNQTGGSEPRLAEEADTVVLFVTVTTLLVAIITIIIVVLVVRHKHKKRSDQIGTSSAHDSLFF
jgi:predicted lysophospholipase L1 biosynthesis ABC-type transport system permease subunit